MIDLQVSIVHCFGRGGGGGRVRRKNVVRKHGLHVCNLQEPLSDAASDLAAQQRVLMQNAELFVFADGKRPRSSLQAQVL